MPSQQYPRHINHISGCFCLARLLTHKINHHRMAKKKKKKKGGESILKYKVLVLLFFLRLFIYLFIYLCIYFRGGKEGEREGKKHQCVVASHMPLAGDLGHNPIMCPRLGIERATLWFTGQCSIH